MAYTTQHLYITVLGIVDNTPEIWQWGTRWEYSGTFSSADLQTIADSLVEPTTDFHTGSPGFLAGHQVVGIKVALIDTDGRYVETASNPAIAEVNPPVGGSSSLRLPLQLATVVTIDSGIKFGRARTGRVYLPPVSNMGGLDTTHRLAAGTCTDLAEQFGGWAKEARDAMEAAVPGLEVFLSIMSSIGSGTTRTANFCRVGRIPDTQRRRRNSLLEEYGAGASVLV